MEDKDYKPDTMQVFDWLKMPHEMNGEETTILIAGYDGANNDTYHRWYPKRVEEEIGQFCRFKTEQELQAAKEMNQWLLDHGMEWDKTDEYFHILIHISW